MRSLRDAKLMMVSALCLMVLAGVIFLLLVLPAMRGGAPASMAQPELPPPPEDVAHPPEMDPHMMDPHMMPDDPRARPEEPEAPPKPPPSAKGPPIEPASTNPFAPTAIVPGVLGDVPLEDMRITNYGANWSAIPISQRLGFPSPEVPPRRAPDPPPSVIGPDEPLRITSILWTRDGQAMAGYEYGVEPEVKRGTLRPGDVVDTWRAVEIRRDHVVVEDRATGTRTEVFMTEKAPEPERPDRTRPRPDTRQQRTRPPGR